MSNFNSFCDEFGLMNLTTIRGNGSAAKFLIISLQDAQLKKSRGVDYCMLFDCKDPSGYERSHCLVFAPNIVPPGFKCKFSRKTRKIALFWPENFLEIFFFSKKWVSSRFQVLK
jgi:hypothetical protein